MYPSILRRAENNTTDGGQEAQWTPVWHNSLSVAGFGSVCTEKPTLWVFPELSGFPNTMLDHIYLSFLSQTKGQNEHQEMLVSGIPCYNSP